jgi:hypothetical protein
MQLWNYTDKEILAVVKAVEYFRKYLLGRKFELHTDHQAIKYLQTCQDLSSRMLRYALRLQNYDFEVHYIKGQDNLSDGLSRPRLTTNSCAKIGNENKGWTDSQLNRIHLMLGHGSANEICKFMEDNGFEKPNESTIHHLIDSCIPCQRAGDQKANFKMRARVEKEKGASWQCDLITPLLDQNGRRVRLG